MERDTFSTNAHQGAHKAPSQLKAEEKKGTSNLTTDTTHVAAMTVSKQHLINQWSDALTGIWRVTKKSKKKRLMDYLEMDTFLK